jgi:two-component system response regulator HydG
MKERILVTDDDPDIRDGCGQVLKRRGYDVYEAETGGELVKKLEKYEYDLILLDLKLPDANGLDLLKHVREKDPHVPVIMITAYGTIQNAVEAMRMGANDFLPKPFEPDELRMVVRRNLSARRLYMENIFLKEELRKKEGDIVIVGRSRPVQLLFAQAEKLASIDSTVLITGESGTGKGLLARYLHELSDRKDAPFVSVDCSTLVSSLFESELFGHVKGAFTGAESDKIGKFEMANGGTLFLDEIANIGLELQAKLLKAVEEKEISRVGSHRVHKVDVRILAATNKDLKEEVRKGRFRDDLFFRLNVVALKTPVLRERKEDIPLLVEHFLEKFGRKYKRPGIRMNDRALRRLVSYHWPGNVRELENIMERMVIFSDGHELGNDDLAAAGLRSGDGRAGPDGAGRPLSLEEMEKQHIVSVLEQTGGNKTEAASILGIDRKTLRLKLQKWGLGG